MTIKLFRVCEAKYKVKGRSKAGKKINFDLFFEPIIWILMCVFFFLFTIIWNSNILIGLQESV